MKIDYSKIKLKAEEKKLLKSNYNHLETAAKHDYSLPLYQRDLIALNDLYIKYINKQGQNISCRTCVLRLLKSLFLLGEATGAFTK